MSHRLTPAAYHEQISADAERLLAAARLDLDRPVPACPGWDQAGLLAHLGRVHRMAEASVAHQLTERPGREHLGEIPERAGLLAWFEAGARRLRATLEATPQERPAWNFTGAEQTASFWSRRQAHETAMHRWDGEAASGPTTPIPPALAVDGIDEFFELLERRVLPAQPGFSLPGSLHLHATDAPGEWMVEIQDGALALSHAHGKAAAALRGRAEDLLLALWRRQPLDAGPCERFGDASVAFALLSLPSL